MTERDFQAELIRELKEIFSGAFVLKIDPTFNQGFPDLLVLYNNKWAALECKANANANHRPNQDYKVSKLNGMSYASFIFPENRKEILNELVEFFNKS